MSAHTNHGKKNHRLSRLVLAATIARELFILKKAGLHAPLSRIEKFLTHPIIWMALNLWIQKMLPGRSIFERLSCFGETGLNLNSLSSEPLTRWADMIKIGGSIVFFVSGLQKNEKKILDKKKIDFFFPTTEGNSATVDHAALSNLATFSGRRFLAKL